MEYNGWTNRATWLVNCWYEPETPDDVHRAREILEDQYDALPDGALKDMIDLREINWDELLDAVQDEEDDDADDTDDL